MKKETKDIIKRIQNPEFSFANSFGYVQGQFYDDFDTFEMLEALFKKYQEEKYHSEKK